MTAPQVVLVAHGTRRPGGNRTARELAAAVEERLGVRTCAAYVELGEPLLADVVAALSGPGVVVPLLLSTGYHVRVDLPRDCARDGVALGPPLGPDPVIAAVQVLRLREAGARPGCPVVLVAAGSSDPAALADLDRAATLLAQAWQGPVRVATLGGLGARAEDVVGPGDAVSPYLLSPGLFSRRLAEVAADRGAAACADVLGAHPLLVDLAARRAAALLPTPADPPLPPADVLA